MVDSLEDLHFCRWTGADPQGTLSARAVGKLVGLLKLQEKEMMTVGDLIDDSNLLQVANEGDESDEDLFEEDTEDEGDDDEMD